MSSKEILLALSGALILSACSGGGGGGSPRPSPSPNPPPVTDTTPPDTTLTFTPPALANSVSATFAASSTEAGSTFEASLDGAAYAAVASNFTLGSLADGAHSVSVRARDAAGNIDATPATFSWTVDATPPNTHIASNPPPITSSSSATFTFTSEAGANFESSVNGAAYSTATSPVQLTGLADGVQTFTVRARDAAGNVDPTPDTVVWLVDTVPPNTSITASPPALTNAAVANFSFGSELGGTYQLSLDGSPYIPSGSSFTSPALGDGAHTLNVRAFDLAGNMDATPASFTWTVDTQAPDTTLTASPAANSNSPSASFAFTSEANATFQASIDGGPFATVTSPHALTGLSSGAHVFSVRATDAAGNVETQPATFNWQVDTSQPAAQIVFPSPVSYTDASELHVRGTASDGHVITAVTVNSVAATTTDAFANWSALVPINPGNNTITISVSDNFGNTNSSAATAMVANRGPVIYELQSIALDSAHNRLLATDRERNAILAVNRPGGFTSIFSDDAHGTGPSVSGFSRLHLDAPNNRVLVMQHPLIAVDLDTGNRTEIPTDTPTPETHIALGHTCNSPCTRLYGVALASSGPSFRLVSVDLQTGARTPVSVPFGSGFFPQNPRGLALDTTTSPARLLLADGSHDAIFAIDITSGDRTFLSNSTMGVGTGPALQNPNGIVLDAANNRLLVVDNPESGSSFTSSRIVAVNLTSGDRTVLPLGGPAPAHAFDPMLDVVNSRLFLATFSPAMVTQIDFASGQFSRFSDSSVGDGPRLSGYSALLERGGNYGSVLTSGSGAVLRVDLATGVRSVAAPGNYPGFTAQFMPKYLAFDRRPGALPNQLLYSDGAGPQMRLFQADLTTATHSMLSMANVPYGASAEFPLDAANSRYIVNYSTGGQSRIVPMDVATGTLGPAIADSAIGTPSFGLLRAMALENPPGQPQSLLAVDSQAPLLFRFNLSTGSRTLLSSAPPNGNGPPLVSADSLTVDDSRRRALALSGNDGAIQWVDLVTGDRTALGGSGPRARQLWPRATVDFQAQLAYVISNSDMLLTVDLVSGDRVITAR